MLSDSRHKVESLDIGFGSPSWPQFLSVISRENRMTLQQVGTVRTTYAYDGDGLRRRMVTPGGTTTYVWDGTDYLGEVK